MRRWLFVSVVAFGIALAVIVAFRLEASSLAVVIGVICGIVGGLPIGAVLLYMLVRERQARMQAEGRRWQDVTRPAATPSVVILNAGRGAEMLPGGFSLGPARPREFVIVGEEELVQHSGKGP